MAEQLREAPSWQQRVGPADWFLLGRLESGPRPSPEIAWAWRRLVASGGGIPIGRLAAEVGWSHKHLITRFRQQVGLRPKTAARLIRFDRVWQRLGQSAGRPQWADLAHEAGYADQAHMTREFRQFTGMTPTQYQARQPRDPSEEHMDVEVFGPCLLVEDVPASARFHVEHFGSKLSQQDRPYELAFVRADHDTVPKGYRGHRTQGLIIGLLVPDATAVAAQLRAAGVRVVLPLRDEPFGQRHVVVADQNDVLVDVVQPIPADPDWLARQGLNHSGGTA